MRLVRNGPWVGAMIVNHKEHGWKAVVDGRVVSQEANPCECREIMKIWTFGRDITRQEYDALTRSGRDVDPSKPVNLTERKPIF